MFQADLALRAKRGVTLIELMITLVVMMIVLMIAAPPFGALLARNKLSATVNDLIATLNLARSTAVMGTVPVTICADNGSGACGTEDDWAKGALVFRDAIVAPQTDQTTDQKITDTEIIAKRLGASGTITITASAAALTYRADGTATTANATPTVFQWVLCDPAGHVSPRLVTVRGNGANYLYQSSACALPQAPAPEAPK